MMLVSIAVMMFAVMDTTSKYLTRFYSVTTIMWFRYLFHSLVVLAWAVPRLGMALTRTAHPWIQLLRGLLLPATSALFVFGSRSLPIAEATAIFFTTPLLVTLLAVVFLGERVGTPQRLALAAGFAGVLIIVRPGGSVFSPAALWPLGAALATAIYQILTRRISSHENPYTSNLFPGVVGFVLFSACLPLAGDWPHDPVHIALLVLVGLFGGIGHLLMIQAIHRAPMSQLAPFSFSQLAWVTLCGFIAFGALPDAWALGGVALLAAAGIYLVTQQRRVAA